MWVARFNLGCVIQYGLRDSMWVARLSGVIMMRVGVIMMRVEVIMMRVEVTMMRVGVIMMRVGVIRCV